MDRMEQSVAVAHANEGTVAGGESFERFSEFLTQRCRTFDEAFVFENIQTGQSRCHADWVATERARHFARGGEVHDVAAATEGYLLPDEIAKAKVPVILHPGMQRCGSMETLNTHLGNGAFLSKKGILLAQGTGFEGYVPKTRVLRCEAAITMINGLGFDKTLKSVTQDAAKLLAIDDKYGSIDVGKEADLVLWDGDPFEHRTHALFTISAGRIVYDRAETLKLPFARRALPLLGGDFGCCMGAW